MDRNTVCVKILKFVEHLSNCSFEIIKYYYLNIKI